MSDALAQNRAPALRELTAAQAAQMGDLLIVDVRQAEELYGDLGHIPAARHVPLDILFTAGPPADWKRDQPLLVVCRSGARSAQAAVQLGAWGFTEVYNLRGGMIGWHRAGLPTTRPEAPAPRFRLASVLGY